MERLYSIVAESTGAETRLSIFKSHLATYSCVTLVKKLTSLGLSFFIYQYFPWTERLVLRCETELTDGMQNHDLC